MLNLRLSRVPKRAQDVATSRLFIGLVRFDSSPRWATGAVCVVASHVASSEISLIEGTRIGYYRLENGLGGFDSHAIRETGWSMAASYTSPVLNLPSPGARKTVTPIQGFLVRLRGPPPGGTRVGRANSRFRYFPSEVPRPASLNFGSRNFSGHDEGSPPR